MNKPEKVIASVCEGKIQGFKNKSSFSGVEFYSFLGVPYGQSTAEHARFKDPVAVKPWKNNILDATTDKGGCYQFCTRKKVEDGSEDCLYNNIHTPLLPLQDNEHSLKAVIVNIHPGGFYTGSADSEDFGSPDYVMHNDIVYVCVSFRIDILGFLNLELKECSGNQGLKDVILSLQWIQRNIRNFGGDPDNITLLGGSSGAEMVNHLIISPLVKGLFHKAIIMGGYKYNPTLINQDKNSTLAFELAKQFGYTGSCNTRRMLQFYRKLHPRSFVLSKPYLFFSENRAPIFPTTPFIVSKDFGENPVVPSTNKQEDSETMKRIPLLIGFCEHESVMGFLPLLKDLTKKNFYTSIRQNAWGWGSKLNDSQLEDIQNRVESYYLNGKSIESASLSLRCNIQTDIALSDVYDSLIDVIAADIPSVYVYKFEFEDNTIALKDLYKYIFEESLPGTFHCDDYFHWNRLQIDDNTVNRLTPESEEMVKTFTKLISTFAKTGNPNYNGISTQWVPTTVENPRYLSINNNNLNMVDGKLNGQRMTFWENLRKEMETGIEQEDTSQ